MKNIQSNQVFLPNHYSHQTGKLVLDKNKIFSFISHFDEFTSGFVLASWQRCMIDFFTQNFVSNQFYYLDNIF